MFALARIGQAVIGLGALLGAGALALLAPQAANPHSAAMPRYYGVNLPSATFGKNRSPGEYGKDYVYPSGAIAEPFRNAGMNAIRLGFLWGRLQRTPFGPLDPEELGRLDHAIDELGAFQLIVLDVHNYGRYKGKKLNDPSTGGALLADLWTKLATHYKGNARVAFGIMNEPNGIDAGTWRSIAEQTVVAIRRTGARNLVLVPGTNWTGGHSWQSGHDGSNAAAMSGFRDPAGNFMFEIHQYLDSDSSGTKPDCSDPGAGPHRLAAVTKWMRAEHARAFLAEFGTPPTPVCLQALDRILDFMDDNGDVWAGWTYWAAGARWHNYPFDIQPDGQPKPQTGVLARHIERYRRSAPR